MQKKGMHHTHTHTHTHIMETSDSISYATEIYTDCSKIGGKVGAGMALYTDKTLVRQWKYKLQDCCSNNEAEQIAILKSLNYYRRLTVTTPEQWPSTPTANSHLPH